jgi:phage I-like protein
MPVASKKAKIKSLVSQGRPLVLGKNRAEESGASEGEATFKLPADGWFQIAKLGDWYHQETGTMQVVDAAAITSMVDAFKRAASSDNFPGLLVDRDHFSHDRDKPTEALCWIFEMEARPDGVWAKGKWTSLGIDLIEGGVYRLVSPVFSDWESVEGGDANRLRPRLIKRVALTNDPNCKGFVPLSNRDDGGTPRGDARNAAGANNMNHRDELCRMLGLEVTASDEELATAKAKADAEKTNKANRMNDEEKQAAAKLKADNDRLTAENTTLRNRQIDSTMDTFGKVIGEKKETWKTRLNRDFDTSVEILREMDASRVKEETEAKNRADAEAAAKGKGDGKGATGTGNKDKADKKPLHNRDNGAHPASADADGKDDNDPRVQAAYAQVQANAKDLMNRSPHLTYMQAFRQELAKATAGGHIQPVTLDV